MFGETVCICGAQIRFTYSKIEGCLCRFIWPQLNSAEYLASSHWWQIKCVTREGKKRLYRRRNTLRAISITRRLSNRNYAGRDPEIAICHVTRYREADDANFLKFETRRDRLTMCCTSEVPNNPITLHSNNISIVMSLRCHEVIIEGILVPSGICHAVTPWKNYCARVFFREAARCESLSGTNKPVDPSHCRGVSPLGAHTLSA